MGSPSSLPLLCVSGNCRRSFFKAGCLSGVGVVGRQQAWLHQQDPRNSESLVPGGLSAGISC